MNEKLRTAQWVAINAINEIVLQSETDADAHIVLKLVKEHLDARLEQTATKLPEG